MTCMNDIEGFIKKDAQQYRETIVYPDLQKFLVKTKITKQRSKQFYVIRMCIVILLCCSFLAGCGVAVAKLCFQDIDRFQNLKQSAKVSELNMVLNVDGIDMTLHSTFYDGKDLYFLISTQGFDVNQVKNDALDPKDKSLLNCIQQAKAITSAGIEYDFKPTVTEQNGNGTSFVYNNPKLYGINLKSNEALLCIENMPSDNHYTIDILLSGMKKHFEFSGLVLEKNKQFIRNVSRGNYTFEISQAKGKIEKITYTEYNTILTVQWEFNDSAAFWDELAMDYIRNYSIYVGDDSSAEKETSIMLFPIDDGTNEKNKDLTINWKNSNKTVTRTSDYEIGLVFSPEDTLQILEYTKKISQPRGDINRTLCVIFPKE